VVRLFQFKAIKGMCGKVIFSANVCPEPPNRNYNLYFKLIDTGKQSHALKAGGKETNTKHRDCFYKSKHIKCPWHR